MVQRGAIPGMLATLAIGVIGVIGAITLPATPADAAHTAETAHTAESARTAAMARTEHAPAGRVVLIGIPSLLWYDLSPVETPTLWGLTGQGSAGGLSVRTTKVTTCPTDGWLTVSAGQRARLPHGDCALPSAPTVLGGGAAVPGWGAIKKDNAGTSYEARVGLLGDAVHAAGGCTAAVGAGAVFGAADGAGKVDVYAPSIDKVPAGGWSRCPLTVVEIDDVFRAYITAGVDTRGVQVPVSREDRATAVAAADRRVAQVLSGLPANATVLVAGLSDTVINIPHLHVALAKGSGFGNAYLSSGSTRQPGLVTLTDLTSTVLTRLRLAQPPEAIGSTWRAHDTSASVTEKVSALKDEDVAAQAIRRTQPAFFIVLFGGQLILYGLAAVALRRRWGNGTTRQRILGATRVIALMGAAAPAASFLANLVPWWRATHPAPALIFSVLGGIVVLTLPALAGPWRRSMTVPCLIISGATALLLGLDVATGSHLQLNALMGYTALVAGRFYGFGNQAFALFAVAALMSAAWLTEFAPGREERRRMAAVAIVAVVGFVTVALDGWPAWGSDFGGVLALVPALAVLGLMTAGKRVSVFRLGLFCVAGAVVVLAIAFVDSLRAEPSHLGRFWDDLMGGEAWGVIGRKAGAMLRSLGYWPFTVAVVGALCFLFFVLARPLQWRAALLHQAYERSSTLRPALVAVLVVAITGMLVNDSGVVIPAVAFSLAIPLTLAASVRALELDNAAAGTPPPAKAPSPSGSTG